MITYSILFLGSHAVALEKVVWSTDKLESLSESAVGKNAEPIFYHPGNKIKELHNSVSDLIKIGENYVELPIRQTDDGWYFSRKIEFLHRIYFFDIVKMEVRQQDDDITGYRVVIYAKKAYEHIIVPPYWYMLDKRDSMIVNLVDNTDRENALDTYTIWKFLSGQ